MELKTMLIYHRHFNDCLAHESGRCTGAADWSDSSFICSKTAPWGQMSTFAGRMNFLSPTSSTKASEEPQCTDQKSRVSYLVGV